MALPAAHRQGARRHKPRSDRPDQVQLHSSAHHAGLPRRCSPPARICPEGRRQEERSWPRGSEHKVKSVLLQRVCPVRRADTLSFILPICFHIVSFCTLRKVERKPTQNAVLADTPCCVVRCNVECGPTLHGVFEKMAWLFCENVALKSVQKRRKKPRFAMWRFQFCVSFCRKLFVTPSVSTCIRFERIFPFGRTKGG